MISKTMFLFFLVILSPCLSSAVELVPALFAFGDSFIDGGNTVAPQPPFGEDLNNATNIARWSNGLNYLDFLTYSLGLPLVPPSRDLNGKNALKGLNYGVSGSGFLSPGGSSFSDQVAKFSETVSSLTALLGKDEAENLVRRSISVVSFGVNDYIMAYLNQGGLSSNLSHMTPEQFARTLSDALSHGLTKLYGLGARKILVNNVWAIGCSPMRQVSADKCNETLNNAISVYNKLLPGLLRDLEGTLPGAVLSVADSFEFQSFLKDNGPPNGITNLMESCMRGTLAKCENGDKFLYFDMMHTTQAANRLFAQHCFNGTICKPRNLLGMAGAV